MKKFFILFLLLIESYSLVGQIILLQEDFSTASSTTPPAGWTVQTSIGDPLVDLWHFDNPGRRSPGNPVAEPFASFDSDKLSDNGSDEEVCLTSPPFDATTAANITLEFDQYFIEGYGGSCEVEIFNGTTWINIYTNSLTTYNPQHSSFDVTTLIQNITNAQIRFKWIGNYSWFWILDNIKVATLSYSGEQFTEQTGIDLIGVYYSSVVWGDYDNDGDLDILLTGLGNSRIYRNNGDNSFTEQTEITLTGVSWGSTAWGDYDNDGDLDILLTGETASVWISKIYRNNSDNTFNEQTDISLPGVYSGSIAWGDYDNDGYLDILLTGNSSSGNISKIYRNNGNNTFSEQTDISLKDVCYCSVAWGDYDNDGDLDILLTGYSLDDLFNSKIYRNNDGRSFTEQTAITLTGVINGSTAWGDYDNDGDLDILVTGNTRSGTISKIYRNNGDNSFTEQTGITLAGVDSRSAAWGDYDNDGDLDVLLTGGISKIYRNNGDNSFTEQTDIALARVDFSTSAWGDYDNDGNLDILLTGQSDIGPVSKIYKNNNSLKNSAPSIPGNLNAIVNYQQVQFNWDKFTDLQTPQDGLTYNLVISSTPGDCDIVTPMSNTANGFRKVVQTGNRSKTTSYTLYSSLPAGIYYWGIQAIDNAYAGSAFAISTFTITDAQAAYLKFSDITTSSVKISWNRGNKEKCAVFVNQTSTGLPTLTNNTTYIANAVLGKGTQAGDGWYCVYNGTGENVTITGLCGSFTYKLMIIEYSGEPGQEYYLTSSNSTNPQTFNTQEQFTGQNGIDLTGVAGSSVAWGDYDNDGYLDILLTGYTSSEISKIYHNNSDNSFTEQAAISLTGISSGSAVWGDYDNDNDLDILLIGYSDGSPISKIYRNNDDNTFTEQTGIELTNVRNGSAEWGDYDNDGYPDILLTGNTGEASISKIYRNNGDNNFTEQTDIKLTGTTYGSVAWGDYDNDKDLDILLTGSADGTSISKIYHNNGNNTFTEQTSISLPGVTGGHTAWGDYDNDGDLDILMTGDSFSGPISKIYRNNGDNNFTNQAEISLQGISGGSAVWGDYDNDGDLDILLTGLITNTTRYISRIYCNNGDNTFTEQTGIVFPETQYSSAAWGDYDNDGDLDFILPGLPASGNDYQTRIYKNNNLKKNSHPTIPSGIVAYLSDKKLTLSWDKATDTETPQSGITYNLRIGTMPGGCEILSPMSLPDSKRTIQAFGNVGLNTNYTIDLSGHIPLPEHIYYSVQAIDNGFMGSAWSPEKSEISDFVVDFLPNMACQKNEIQFQDKSYSIQYPVTIYLWKFTEDSTITTSSLQNPIHTFQTSGTHEVELIITNSNSETISTTKSIIVLPSPLTDFTAPNVCQGVPVLLDNTTNANSTTINSWLWSFGDNTTNLTLEEPGNHGYLNPGEYVITLKAFADNSCAGSISKTVTVSNYPVAEISSNAPLLFCQGSSADLSVSYNSDYSYRWLLNDIYITDADSSKYTAEQSGNYKVEVVNRIGNCKNISSAVNVGVKTMPYKPVIFSDNYEAGRCLYETPIKLNVDQAVTGYNYQWFRNGVPISSATLSYLEAFLVQGDYSLEADLDGCKSISDIFKISFSNSPEKPLIYVQGPIVWYLACSNDSASKYKWYCNDRLIEGAEKYYYVANRKMGDYQVSIGNDQDCYTRSDVVTVPTGATGINDINPFAGLKIYPNPAPGVFSIEMDNDVFGELTIDILNEQGKEIFSIKYEKSTEHFSTEVNLGGQVKGMYIINLIIEKYFTARKLIIE